MNGFPEVTSSNGPKGDSEALVHEKGPVVSDGCWDCNFFHNTPLCKSQAEGHQVPNQRDTVYLLRAAKPKLPRDSLAVRSTYLFACTNSHKHTCAHTS